MSRRRQLSEEERALWRGFARSITPMRGLGESLGPSPGDGNAEMVAGPSEPVPVAAPKPTPPVYKALPLAPLGRRLKHQVARGKAPIEARLDLHGKTQSEAHAALLAFVRSAQAEGAKIVLVVTGKGVGNAADPDRRGASERGVLRRQVPLWLSLPEFRVHVLSFEDAHAFHGGRGALYVRLRRRR